MVQINGRFFYHVEPADVKYVWAGCVLVSISIISQITLCILGILQKYTRRTRVRMGLWVAYLLAYSVAPAVLGILTQTAFDPTARPHGLNTSDLMSFWASFILLHLGGPDSITAFALEDNELSSRYFAEMVFQSGVVLYILLLSWPGCSYLPQLSILVCLAGFVKCFQRIQALRLASTDNLHDSILGTNHPNFLEDLKKSQGLDKPPFLRADDKLISEAYRLFQTFKGLFVDLVLPLDVRESSQSYFRRLQSGDAFRIVEIELGFAYDMFYTKAGVVYTFKGLMLRLASFLFLLTVPVCFYIRLYDMDYHTSIDIVITHLLVGLAIFMDVFSFITMLRSDWTDLWLSRRNLTRNILVFPFLKHPAKQRWSGSIGQFDLLSVAIGEKPATCLKIQKFFGIDFICAKHRYKTYTKVSDNLKHLIYKHFRVLMVFDFPPKECSLSLGKNERGSLIWSGTSKVEFDHSILIWHIATTLCYYSELYNQDEGDIYACRTESNHISNYLMYLLVTYPLMLPVGISMVRYRDTYAEAMSFFNEKGAKTAKVEACRKLLEVVACKVKGGQSKSALFDGCRLALTLKKMEREPMWKVISQVWIEILAYAAAAHCRGFHHKQHLRKGGEFLTHVWLLMAHLGVTEQFQEFQGHSKARINM